MKEPGQTASKWWAQKLKNTGVPRVSTESFEKALFNRIKKELKERPFVFLFCDRGPRDILQEEISNQKIELADPGELTARMKISSEMVLLSEEKGSGWKCLWTKR